MTVEDLHRDKVVELFVPVYNMNLPEDPDFTKEQKLVKERIGQQLNELTGNSSLYIWANTGYMLPY